MNIYDISKKAGVSIATVSRVLNNSSKVSEATRQRVMSLIKDYNYVPHKGRTQGSDSRTITYICCSITHYCSAFFAEQIMQTLSRNRYHIDIISCGNDLSDKKQAFESALHKKSAAIFVDGTDFLEYNPTSNNYIVQAALTTPVFMLNGVIDAPGIYCAYYDIEKTIFTLTDSALKKGAKNPLFLFSAMSTHQMAMLNSFKMALELNKIELKPEMTQLCQTQNNSSKVYVTGLISEGYVPDYIITSDDRLLGMIYDIVKPALNSAGSDCQFVTCNLSDIYEIIESPVYSIDCCNADICRHATSSFLKLADGIVIPSKTVFPASIIH